jgi:hypothetical protein
MISLFGVIGMKWLGYTVLSSSSMKVDRGFTLTLSLCPFEYLNYQFYFSGNHKSGILPIPTFINRCRFGLENSLAHREEGGVLALAGAASPLSGAGFGLI